MLTLRAIKATWLTLLLMAGASFAETKYVTDLKYVNLYSKPNKNSETLMYLPSGTRVKVVYEGQHFAKVKIPEGETGWLSSGHLDPTKPSLIKFVEAKRELDQAKRELESERKALTQQIEQLKQELLQARATNFKNTSPSAPLDEAAILAKCPKAEPKECPEPVATANNTATTGSNAGTATPEGTAKSSSTQSNNKPQKADASAEPPSLLQTFSNPIVLGVIGGVFLLSLLLCWAFFDWRRRRRFGGLRI